MGKNTKNYKNTEEKINKTTLVKILENVSNQFGVDISNIINELHLKEDNTIKVGDIAFLIPQNILQVRKETIKKINELINSDDFKLNKSLIHFLHEARHEGKK